LLVLMLCERR